MKNQYFGDINDYKKYSLLRILSGNGQIRTSVCWALTLSDNRGDGGFIEYLDKPEKWRQHDPAIFDCLRADVIVRGIRDVKAIERSKVLSNCRFYSELIPAAKESRDDYFNNFYKVAKGADLIFFDPDNGIAVKSVPKGRKGSSKYIYEDELQHFFNAGHSILLYQHFPHRPRDPFISESANKLKRITGSTCVFSYRTSQVVFLLVPQPRHIKLLSQYSAQVEKLWGAVIRVETH